MNFWQSLQWLWVDDVEFDSRQENPNVTFALSFHNFPL